MIKDCYCPKTFNIATGIFIIFLAFLAFFNVWQIYMPVWLNTITLTLGILLIFFNSINPIGEKVKDAELDIEKPRQIDTSTGY